jgi:putative metallohydrolase (TIGR04338 family)
MYGRSTTNGQGNRGRDTQRSKLYAAEAVLHGPPDFKTIQECQAFVDAVMASRWVAARFRNPRIEVEPGYGRRSACAVGDDAIRLPIWSRQKPVILHEIAHCLIDYGYTRYAWHGPEFAGLLLSLVHHVLGQEAAAKLRASFKAHRVRTNLKALPSSPRYTVVPKAVVQAKARQRAATPLTSTETTQVAALLRRAAKAGQLGTADRKPRQHALATARLLEGVYS